MQQTKEFASRNPLITMLIGLLVILLVRNAPVLFQGQVYFRQDSPAYFEPFCTFIGESLRHGHLPVWNPYIYCGMPMTPMMSPSALYPVHWLFALLPFSQTVAIYVILHQLLTAAGGFLLAKRLGISTAGSIVAALGCALNGYMITLISNFTLIGTAAWIPICIYGILSIGDKFTPANIGRVAAVALAVAMSILAGRPELFAANIGLLLLVSAVLLVKEPVKTLAFRILAIAGGVFFAAPMLLPAYEWWVHSVRRFGLPTHQALEWSANWCDWLSLVVLQPVGDRLNLHNQVAELVASRPGALAFVPDPYIGLLFVVLAGCALLDWRWKPGWAAAGLLVVFVILTAGAWTPIAPWLMNHFPSLAILRYPVKLIVMVSMLVAVLAGKGFDVVTQGGQEEEEGDAWRRPYVVGIAAVPTLALLAVGFWLINSPELVPSFATMPIQTIPGSVEVPLSMQVQIGRACIESGMLGMGLLILLIAERMGQMPQRLLRAVVLAGVCWSLVAAAVRLPVATTDASYYTSPSPIADDLKSFEPDQHNDRVLMMFTEPFVGPITMRPLDDDYYRYCRRLLTSNQSVSFKLHNAYGYEAAASGAYDKIASSLLMQLRLNNKYIGAEPYRELAPVARFCQLASVRFLTVQDPLTVPPPKQFSSAGSSYFWPAKLERKDNVRIYTFSKSRPRAYFAAPIHWSTDFGKMIDIMVNRNNTDLLGPRESWVKIPPGERAPIVRSEASDAADDSVTITSETDDSVTIATQSKEPQVLVLSDSYYPGWQAHVDGRRSPVGQCNGFFRATLVPAGKHEVVFSFRPYSLKYGLITAILTLIALAGLWLVAWLKSRRTAA